MLRRIRLILIAMTLLASACADAPPGQAPRNDPRHADAPYVVLVSLDGFRYDYLDRYPTPTLQRMISEGVRAERMIPTFPTKTYPTHYSVATGMYAETHGLVGNRFWSRERGEAYDIGDRATVEDGSWYRGEPIWVTAELQGMRSASFFFIGSEADVQGRLPTYWRRYDASIPNEDRVAQVLNWLAMPVETRPHVIALYFSDLDDAGHAYGPESRQVAQAVERVDGHLARLTDGIDALPHGSRVYVVVTSDHGMMAVPPDQVQVVDPDAFPGVRVAEINGPYASFYVEEGGPGQAVQVRDSLRALVPGGGVWLREELPARFHYSADPNAGDIVALAQPGWIIRTPSWLPDRTTYTHGWDNQTPEMGAVFLARGPGIRRGLTIDAFESVHVYPLLAHVLGLRPNPDADGRLEVLLPVLEDAR